MFLDFAFLTRLGDLWDPLDSSLWIKLLQQGPTLVLPFAYLSLFPLGSADLRVIFILNPRASAPLSVGPTRQSPVATRGNSGLAYRKLGQSGVPWERDMCSSYRDLSAHSGGFAGLVLPLSKCLVTGIPRLIGSSWEKEYPSFTVRAYNGLSGTPLQGIIFRKPCPRLCDRWEFVNVRL